MIMKVRLNVLKDIKIKHYKLSEKYYNHLKKRTQIKGFDDRSNFKFVI